MLNGNMEKRLEAIRKKGKTLQKLARAVEAAAEAAKHRKKNRKCYGI